MTPEEVYRAWAPPDSVWSPWVIPVPFAEIVCAGAGGTAETSELESLGAGFHPAQDLGMVVDLPGGDSICLGLALSLRGFRPVPVINGCPGPFVIFLANSAFASQPLDGRSGPAVDMREILRGLCFGAGLLPSLRLSKSAPPAFLLDSMRLAGGLPVRREAFDNRWKAFPEDFPSAQFLQEQGIKRILLVQERAGQPKEDLSHVLLRWQEAGLHIFSAVPGDAAGATAIRVSRPSRYRALWYRALAMLGLRRGSAGGFGGWPPSSTSG